MAVCGWQPWQPLLPPMSDGVHELGDQALQQWEFHGNSTRNPTEFPFLLLGHTAHTSLSHTSLDMGDQQVCHGCRLDQYH